MHSLAARHLRCSLMTKAKSETQHSRSPVAPVAFQSHSSVGGSVPASRSLRRQRVGACVHAFRASMPGCRDPAILDAALWRRDGPPRSGLNHFRHFETKSRGQERQKRSRAQTRPSRPAVRRRDGNRSETSEAYSCDIGPMALSRPESRPLLP